MAIFDQQGGFQPFLQRNSGSFLNAGLGLLSGRNAQEQAAGAVQGFAQARQQNKTLDFLRRTNPELAQAVEAGVMPADKAFALDYEQKLQAQQPVKPIEVNGRLVNPSTFEVMADFSTPNDASSKGPQVVELFDDATGQPYKATWNPQTGAYERVGGVKARSGMQLTTNPDGTVSLTEGSIANMPKLTESEGRNSGFYGRGVKSHDVLKNLESLGTSLWNSTAGKIPVAGNYMVSQDAQKYDQAKRDFINAVLRRESGAVISPDEFNNAEKQYFPQPGDGPEVIRQKRGNRETTIQGLKISSGQGANFAIPPGARLRFNPATGELE